MRLRHWEQSGGNFASPRRALFPRDICPILRAQRADRKLDPDTRFQELSGREIGRGHMEPVGVQ
jgi:hypothetical protein